MGKAVTFVSSFETAVKHNAQMRRLKREPFELSPNINSIIYRYLFMAIYTRRERELQRQVAGQDVLPVVQFELPSMSNETIAFFFLEVGGIQADLF